METSPVPVIRPNTEACAHLPHFDRLVPAAAHLAPVVQFSVFSIQYSGSYHIIARG